MRKTTRTNLETKTLKAFCDVFAHHKNAEAKISDWVSYIPVELQGNEFVVSLIRKLTRNNSLQRKWITGRVWMC